MNVLQKLFSKKTAQPQGITLELQSGFTAFSGTAYANAAYRAAVDAIARHTAKLTAHTGKKSIENLLQKAPNPYMTAYDLLYKTATAYYTTNNAFVLVQYDKGITAFYPLTPASVEFIGAQDGEIYANMTFTDGKQVLLPYSELIHLRRHFSNNELLGSDNAPLYPLIDTAHTLNEATGAAVKNATNIRGILKFTSLVNPAQVKLEKEQFVKDYLSVGTDLQAHKVNYNNNPILKWCLTNTGVQTDRNGNIVPIKNQSPKQRIDGTAALLDCYAGLYEHYNEYTGAI